MRDPHRFAHATRRPSLAALACGLTLAPLADVEPPNAEVPLLLGALAVACAGTPGRGVAAQLGWAAGAALIAMAAGLALGAARVEAIDSGAMAAAPGRRVALRGFVGAVPRRSDGDVRVVVETADGRALVAAREPVPELAVGHEVAAQGAVREPRPWEAPTWPAWDLAVVHTSAIDPTGRRRGGLAYLLDRVRERAEAALTRGTPESESALLRGFVLGEDDRIDPGTVAEFQASGLAHLLAVSGQNVLLLALLPALSSAFSDSRCGRASPACSS